MAEHYVKTGQSRYFFTLSDGRRYECNFTQFRFARNAMRSGQELTQDQIQEML